MEKNKDKKDQAVEIIKKITTDLIGLLNLQPKEWQI